MRLWLLSATTRSPVGPDNGGVVARAARKGQLGGCVQARRVAAANLKNIGGRLGAIVLIGQSSRVDIGLGEAAQAQQAVGRSRDHFVAQRRGVVVAVEGA